MRNFHGIGEVPMTPPAQMQPYEEPHAIPYDVTLTGNQELLQQGVFIDQDGDFVLKGIVGSQSGSVKNTNLVGTAQFPVPVEPNVVFPAGSKVAIDIKDTSGSSNTVQILLIGSKLLKTR